MRQQKSLAFYNEKSEHEKVFEEIIAKTISTVMKDIHL